MWSSIQRSNNESRSQAVVAMHPQGKNEGELMDEVVKGFGGVGV